MSEMNILGVRWFTGKTCIGIVRVENDVGEISYYIAQVLGYHEEADAKYIAEWGTRFPSKAGDVLFGIGD